MAKLNAIQPHATNQDLRRQIGEKTWKHTPQMYSKVLERLGGAAHATMEQYPHGCSIILIKCAHRDGVPILLTQTLWYDKTARKTCLRTVKHAVDNHDAWEIWRVSDDAR